MSQDLMAVPSSSPSPAEHRRGGGLPLSKLLEPLRWYTTWVRTHPESATSLEQFSRTLTMLWSDPTNLITSEACFALCKLHTFSNHAIISTGGRRTTATELLAYVLQSIQELECLMELVYRKYAGHRRAWDALLLLEAVKCSLKACVHHQLFLVPWLWESMKLSLRRALRHLTTLTPRRRLRGHGGVSSGSGSFAAAVGGGYDGPLTQMVDYGGGGGSACLRGDVVGPNNTRLVIPRVASDRRHEHRHVYRPGMNGGGGGGDVCGSEDHVTFASDAGADDEDVDLEEAEAIGFTWVDVLGMVLDLYLLLRPLLLVAAARRAFMALPDELASTIAVLPPPVSRKELADAAKAAAAAAAEAKKTGVAAPPATPGPDPLAMLHKAMSATPQQTLLGNWRVWASVAGCDLLVTLLARLVRRHRVPVVYIKDSTESEDGAAPVAAPDAADDDGVSGGGADDAPTVTATPSAAAAAATGGGGAGAIGPVLELPVVSRDRMRVQQALRNVLFNVLRDPLFTAVLKPAIYHHLIRGFVNRIPLLGPCISFYIGHYLCMQHYTFLYTLGQ